MFRLIKQVFIVLLSFSSSVAPNQTKCLFLNDELCMVRPTVIDWDPAELKHDPFIISLINCSGSCNILSPKICVPKETKDINVKTFNMIRNKNEAKAMTKHISCKNSNQNWNNKTCQCECKNYLSSKKKSKYLKSIADAPVTEFDDIVIVVDKVSTKKTNTIATNFTSIASINCHSKKVRDCYILHTVLLVIILLLMITITIICYHYAKQEGTI